MSLSITHGHATVIVPSMSTQSRVEAVVTDLDGTFWSTSMEVHDETHETVRLLDEAGIPLLVATGRRAQSAHAGLLREGLHERPIVLMNGGLARDRTDGDSFLRALIDTDDAACVFDAFVEHGLEPLIYLDDPHADLIVGEAPAASASYISSAPGVNQVGNLRSHMLAVDVIGFGAFGYTLEQLEPIASSIEEGGWATAIIGESLLEGDHGLMIQGFGIDKQTGIEAWAKRNGIDAANIAALGDGANDLNMLRSARVAIVPDNASESVRAVADHLVPPNEDGGWSEVREILGL